MIDQILTAANMVQHVDPGFDYPPDAGDSTLAAWGLANPMVGWLLRQAPELLEWSPIELAGGIANPPKCPNQRCQAPMALKVVEAQGRLPRRLVWACHRPIFGSRYGGHTDCGGRRALRLDRRAHTEDNVGLLQLLKWTAEGKAVEYQPDQVDGSRHTFAVDLAKPTAPEPPKKRKRKAKA